jgi:hypothetical protein
VSKPTENRDVVQCIECHLEIPKGAGLCSHCGSHQSKLRNQLRYLASILGIFTFVATGVSVSLAQAPALRRVFFWHDEAKVLAFADDHEIVVANVGDGPLFLLSISISFPEVGITRTVRLGENIEPNAVASTEISGDSAGGGGVVGSVPVSEWGRLRKSSRECFSFDYLTPDHVAFVQLQRANGPSFQSAKANGELFYYSIKERRAYRAEFPLRAVLVRSTTPECVARSGGEDSL